MRQNVVIIGDTHFGTRNNSMIWLKHQRDGFHEIIEYVKGSMMDYDETIVIHVGDLFDSRSAINPMVYKTVETLMCDMNTVLKYNNGHTGRMFIIGGNHDYYYQWESENNYSSTLMLPEFDNIKYVNTNYEIFGDFVMIPWFLFHNHKVLSHIMEEINNNPNGGKKNIIFTHTDPFHMDPIIRKIIHGNPLVTGHIHQPVMDSDKFLLVTGASYPIDFTDTNSERGFWTFNGGINLSHFHADFHPIKSSIHFHTITEQALGDWKKIGIKKDDYVEVQIHTSHVDDYKDVLKELNDNFNTNMMYLTEVNEVIMEHTGILSVDNVCKKLLPPKLIGIYQRMVDECG